MWLPPLARRILRAARCEQDEAIAQFIATQPVAGHIASLSGAAVPHRLKISTRLKRIRPDSSKKRKKYDYGIVMHIKPGATMGITVLWMRDAEAMDPELNESAEDHSKLASYKNNYLEAAKKSAVPQKASYDLLKTYWYAHTATISVGSSWARSS